MKSINKVGAVVKSGQLCLAVFLVGYVTLTCGTADEDPYPKRKGSMIKLELKATPEAIEVLPGEQLWVDVVVTNVGDEPVELPNLESADVSPVTFELRSVETGEVAYTVSQVEFREKRGGYDTLEEEEADPITLAPRQSMELSENIAEYASQGFVPGRYQIVAEYPFRDDTIESSPTEFRVDFPKINREVTAYCLANDVFSAVFDHTRIDKTIVVYEKETDTGDPQDGVYVNRLALTDTRPLTGLATSVHVDYELEGRWFAWLQNGALAAAKVWGTVVQASLEPVSVDLEQPRLISAGFQRDDNSGLFVVVGMRHNEVVAREFLVTEQGARSLNALPLCYKMPDTIISHYSGGGSRGRLTLIWGETQPGLSQLYARSYTANGQAIDPAPRMLYERKSPLVYFDIEAFDDGDPKRLHALFGPEDPESPDVERKQMSYVRIDVGPTKQLARRSTFPVPEDPVDNWAVSSREDYGLPVVALSRKKLLWTLAEQAGSWMTLVEDMGTANKLCLLSSEEGNYWAQWLDPNKGIRTSQLPLENE